MLAPRRLLRTARRGMLAGLAAFAAAVVLEQILEVRDTSKLTTDDTFCSVRGKRVRYRLEGATRPGPTIVLLSGLMGSIEQWHKVQDPLARASPVLAYDRGGMGFSEYTDAHDADAQAEELEGLLHAVPLSPPFVVVSYSASALMARRFVARHADEVQGVVLFDPILPETSHPGPRQFISLMIQSLVGFTRLKMRMLNKPASTRTEQKERAILSSFHHWYATAQDFFRLGSLTPRLMAPPPFRPIPVAVFSSFDAHGAGESAVANSRALAAESPRGTFLSTHLDHGTLVTDPVGSSIVIDLVQTVENQARSPENQTSTGQ